MFNRSTILLLFAFISLCGSIPAQVAPRIDGLQSDTVYMQLLERFVELRHKEDSLNMEVDNARSRFRTDVEERSRLADDILRLEGEIFDTRNEMGIVAGRINNIEQQYVIDNLFRDDPEPLDDIDRRQYTPVPNFVYNAVFEEELQPEDRENLIFAQGLERKISEDIKIYIDNLKLLANLSEAYKRAASESEADTIMRNFEQISGMNDLLAQSVKPRWEFVFDNKTFAYNYLLDKRGDTRLQNSFAGELSRAREVILEARTSGRDEMLSYYKELKSYLLGCELEIALSYGLTSSADSIRSAVRELGALDLDIPAPVIEERYFLVFEDITTGQQNRYTTSNPIPPTTVYERGTIYRILLGSYQKQQQPTVFRGAYPLSVHREDGQYNYYAGGYSTYAEAEEAHAKLKAAGFRAPKIIVWENGSPTDADGDGQMVYNVVLKTLTGILPDLVREIIKSVAPDREVVRIGDDFQIGPFPRKAEALALADKIREQTPSADIEVSEYSQ